MCCFQFLATIFLSFTSFSSSNLTSGESCRKNWLAIISQSIDHFPPTQSYSDGCFYRPCYYDDFRLMTFVVEGVSSLCIGAFFCFRSDCASQRQVFARCCAGQLKMYTPFFFSNLGIIIYTLLLLHHLPPLLLKKIHSPFFPSFILLITRINIVSACKMVR